MSALDFHQKRLLEHELRDRLDALRCEPVPEPAAAAAVPVQPARAAEIRVIERRLHLLDGDDFGRCVDCGADIPFVRLRLHPQTECCEQCEQLQRGRPMRSLRRQNISTEAI